MLPKDVYVVYGTRDDEILSVHSLEPYARLAQRDLVMEDIRLLSRKTILTADDRAKINLHYAVTTLQEALEWMTQTHDDYKLDPEDQDIIDYGITG